MLVLSRKKNESIVVDGNIRVVVVDIRGDKVQIGIEAPKDVPVFRSEVLEKAPQSERPRKSPQSSLTEVVTLNLTRSDAILSADKGRGEDEQTSRSRKAENKKTSRRQTR